jgi:choloylglycine hydrolase
LIENRKIYNQNKMYSLLLFVTFCLACSDFQLKTKDGSIICGRTMDFVVPIQSKVQVFNRGMNMSSKAPDGNTGLTWTSKYGYVGINAFHYDIVSEGMNEMGLSCGFLVLESSRYHKPSTSQYNNSIAVMDVCNWILGSFSTTAEVTREIMSHAIWGNVMPPPIKEIMGLHIPIHDAAGNNLVIEFLYNTLVYPRGVGVLTNDPPLPYHLENLVLYNGLSPYTPKPIEINGYKVSGGGGSGMQGIPGSWSSIDRFVRIATMVRYLDKLKTAMDGVLAVTYILDSINVPSGMGIGFFQGHQVDDITRWSTIKDLTNLIFYYRNGDGALRAVYLDKINFEGSHKSYPVDSDPMIIDVTGNLQL